LARGITVNSVVKLAVPYGEMKVKTLQIGGSDPDFPDYFKKMRLVFLHAENRFPVLKKS